MTIKEYMNRAWGISSNIKSLVRSYSETPENTEYSKLIGIHTDRLIAVKQEIEQLIEQVEDNTLQALLRDRYINFLPWEQIAENIHYESSRWVRTAIHNKALNAAEEILKGEID